MLMALITFYSLFEEIFVMCCAFGKLSDPYCSEFSV